MAKKIIQNISTLVLPALDPTLELGTIYIFGTNNDGELFYRIGVNGEWVSIENPDM